MLFSESRRFVFIAVPKTGSSTIQKHLLKIDPGIKRDEVLDEVGQWRRVSTHSTVMEVKSLMGTRANDYTFVAFFRNPHDVVRSKYYFYVNGRPAKSYDQGKVAIKDDGEAGIISLATALRVLFARMLPLSLWAAVYPFKTGARFIVDKKGHIAVDEIGDFARFNDETHRILSQFGYSDEELALPLDNVSEYDKNSAPPAIFERIVSMKMPRDARIYAAVEAKTQPGNTSTTRPSHER